MLCVLNVKGQVVSSCISEAKDDGTFIIYKNYITAYKILKSNILANDKVPNESLINFSIDYSSFSQTNFTISIINDTIIIVPLQLGKFSFNYTFLGCSNSINTGKVSILILTDIDDQNCTLENCNLVRNGNFEQVNNNEIPDAFSEIYKACGWGALNNTPDYHHTNSPNSNLGVGVPCNNFGFEPDNIIGNNAYAGIIVGPNSPNLSREVNYNEIIFTRLNQALQPNTTYNFSMDISVADFYNRFTSQNIQILVSPINYYSAMQNPNPFGLNFNYLPMQAGTQQGENMVTHNIVNNINGWQRIEANFTTDANGNGIFLYIGNLNIVENSFLGPFTGNLPNTSICDNLVEEWHFTDLITSYLYIDNVELKSLPLVEIIESKLVCENSNLQANVTPPSINNTFEWSNGSTTSNINVVTGSYTVTVTNSIGCTATASATVETIPPPTPTISQSGSLCNGGSVSLTATGAGAGGTYAWSHSLGSNATATVTTAGTYTVTATNTAGCTATASIDVQPCNNPCANYSPTITFANTAYCVGTAGTTVLTTVSPAGTYSFAWSNGSTTQNPLLTAGTYTVTVTNENTCTATAQVAITENALPTPTISQSGTLCNGASVTLTATGAGTGGTYAWSHSLGSNATATVTTAGTYTVTATNTAGCTATASIDVQPCNNPCANYSPTITFANTAYCVGTAGTTVLTTVSPAGTYSFAWSNGSTTQNPALTTGSYTVTVTNENTCTATATVSITEHTLPTAGISGATELCQGNTAILTANGGSTYVWSNGNTTPQVSINNGGNYCVTVTNSNSCSATACHSVIMHPVPTSISIVSNSLCPQQAVELCVQGLQGGVVTNWSTGNDNLCETVTTDGNYCVSAGNHKDCLVQVCQQVNIPQCFTCSNCPPPVGYTYVTGRISQLIANGTVPAPNTNSSIPPQNGTPVNWFVTGALEIDVPFYDIPNNSDIICDANASIFIRPNCGLNIYQAHLYAQSCCLQMWRGITVAQPTITGTIPNRMYTGNGGTLFCDGAFIEDAYEAIQFEPQTLCLIANTRFANNFVGVKYTTNPTILYPRASVLYANILPIRNCIFETTRNVYAFTNLGTQIGGYATARPTNNAQAPRGFAGVYLHCLADATIGVDGANNGNIFRNIPNGILAYNTKMATSNNVFENITQNMIADNLNAVPSGIGVLSSSASLYDNITTKSADIAGLGGNATSPITFNNVTTAIQSTNSDLIVHHVRTSRTLQGVNITNTRSIQQVDIQDNYIEANRIALRIANSENAHIAITENNLRLVPLNSFNFTNNGRHTISIEEVLPYTGAFTKQLFNNREITFATNAVFPNANSAAIHLSGAQGWSITDNLNIRLGVRNVQAGIKLAGCSNNLIENNAIKGLGTGTTQVMMTNSYPMAIRIENSNANTIHCNQTSETFSGINVAGVSSNAILGNQIGSHRIGWHVPANTDCNRQEYMGNRWVGTYTTTAGTNNNPLSIVTQQQIKVTSGVLPLFPNNNWPVSPNIFIFRLPSTPDYTCPQFLLHQPAELGDIADIPTDTTITDTDMGAVLELNAFDPTFNESLLWMGKKQVFEKLEENPDLQWANAEVASFYTEQQAESIGKLSQAEAYTATALSLLPAEKETIAQAEYEKQPLEASLDSLNLSLSTTADTDSMQSLLNEKQAVQAQIAEKDSTIQQTYTNATLSKAIYIDMGKEEVQQVYDEKYIATAYKEMYSLFLEKLSTDSLYYTDDEISLLQGIAYTCPIIGGKATYMARNILAGLRSTDEYNDYDLCAQAGISMARVAHHSPPMEGQGVGIKVYPNPATDIISIIGNIECTNMVIFDSKGAKQIEISNNAKTINIKQLANGLYYLVLFKNSEVVQKISFHKL